MDNLLAYAAEAGVFRQIRDIAVHVTVDLDMLNDLTTIGFQSAVEIMEVVDSRNFAGCGIEELCRYCLRQRIVALLLPAADEVVAVFGYHAVKLGNLVGRILKVGVHSYDNITLSHSEAGVQRRRLAVVAPERDAFQARVARRQLSDYFPRAVGRTVVDKPNLIAEVVGVHDAFYPCRQLGQRFGLVEEGHYYRYIHCLSSDYSLIKLCRPAIFRPDRYALPAERGQEPAASL